ncbi:MAG: hypothetical protein JW716_04135 [Candidatus Aenigmarchaeota archaeon]|nr:hypothetical protein [Candidatus Aenigmarchaeota archaeon]
MKGKYLFIGILMAVLLAANMSAASAASMDMDVYPLSTSACPCTTISEVRVFVTNLGSVSDTYDLSLVLPAGWGKGFIGTYQGGHMLTLGPQETSKEGDITVYITPSCTAEAGMNEAKIVAKNERTGEVIEKTFMIEILTCRGIGITAPSMDMCEGVADSYTFSVGNVGKVAESFDVAVSAPWGELTRQSVTLGPNEAQDITLLLDIPEEYKDVQKLDIEVKSQSSYAEAKKTVELNVRDCYKFTVYPADAVKSVCIGDEARFVFVIENNGLKADTYTIATNDNVEVDKAVVTVAPQGQESVKVTAKSFEAGTTSFQIEVASEEKPEQKQTVRGKLNAKECKSVAVVPSEGAESAQAVCYGKPAQFQFKVQNTGTIFAVYELSSDFGTLSETSVSLESGESKTVTLTVNTASEMEIGDTAYITVKAVSDTVESEHNLELTATNCYGASLEITSDDDGRQICVCDNVDYVVIVKNSGQLKDEFELEFLGETKTFSLEQGEQKEFSYVYGTLGKEPGMKEFTAVLTSKYVTLQKTVNLNVEELEACFDVDISVNGVDQKNIQSQTIQNTKKVEVCDGISFSLSVKNVGSKADSYMVTAEGPEWVFLSANNIILDVGEEREIYVYAAPEYGADLGVYTLNVKVESPKDAKDEVGLVVNVVERGTITEIPSGAEPLTNQTGNVTNEIIGDITTDNATSNITVNMTIPTGAFTITEVSGRAAIIGLIALAIIAILVIRFFVK